MAGQREVEGVGVPGPREGVASPLEGGDGEARLQADEGPHPRCPMSPGPGLGRIWRAVGRPAWPTNGPVGPPGAGCTPLDDACEPLDAGCEPFANR